METLLLIITTVSLVVAAVSATVAWRITQVERRRQATRVAALATAADVPVAAPPDGSTGPDAASAPAGLAAASTGPAATTTDVPLPAGFLAADASGSGSGGRQSRLLVAAATVAVLVVGGGLFTLTGARAARGPVAAAPLELLALTHARSDGALAVSGLVRNPAAGAAVPDLEAEVRVFDAAGLLVATRATRVDSAALEPGQEAAFVVPLGEAATAARYRVSFRSGGTMRHHVDRRPHTPAVVDRTAEAR
jgi:hypothetical protein